MEETNINIGEIRSFIDGEGRVTAIPAKRKKQLTVLYYILSRLPRDTVWSERELTEELKKHHTFGDPAWIRRELCDLGFMERDIYGTRYELKKETPDINGGNL